MQTRRAFALCLASAPAVAYAAPGADPRLAALEKRIGGRLGVQARETTGGRVLLSHRASERFPMCSTFKMALAGMVLSRVDQEKERLDRPVAYGKADILSHAPTTEANLAKGALSVAVLCQAAVELSDNTAANLLLRESGGPRALTQWLRGIGDKTTRLDRTEPSLNEALTGDLRDTTTPEAMTATVQSLLLGQVLKPGSRQTLMGWMVASTTGAARLRAGMAPGWSAAEKTGTGAHGTVQDIGLLIPAQGAPIAVAVYTHGATADQAVVEKAHAEIARLLTGGRA